MNIKTASRFLQFILLVAAFVPVLQAKHDYDRARVLIAQTDKDLRSISRAEALSGKEKERYDEALRRVSEFDQDLSKGKYEEHKLEEVIEHVDNVLKSNAVSPSARDALRDDLKALRELRKDWD